MTGTVAMSLDAMQGWFDRAGASDLEVTVAPGADPVAVQAAIRKVVAPETFVYSGDEALDGVASALDQVIAVITIIAWIVVVVSAVTLLNTLMLSVLDRRREIGVLRAIGATRALHPEGHPGRGGGYRHRRRATRPGPRRRHPVPDVHRLDQRPQHRRRVAAQSVDDRHRPWRAGDLPARFRAARGAGGAAQHRRGGQRRLTVSG